MMKNSKKMALIAFFVSCAANADVQDIGTPSTELVFRDDPSVTITQLKSTQINADYRGVLDRIDFTVSKQARLAVRYAENSGISSAGQSANLGGQCIMGANGTVYTWFPNISNGPQADGDNGLGIQLRPSFGGYNATCGGVQGLIGWTLFKNPLEKGSFELYAVENYNNSPFELGNYTIKIEFLAFLD